MALLLDVDKAVGENEPFSTAVIKENAPFSTAVAESEPSTALAESEPSTAVAENEPSTAVAENELSTAVAENEPSTALAENKPFTAAVGESELSESELLEKIRKAGEDIPDTYCYKRDNEPTMLPPIPNNSKFIDRYPEETLTEENIGDKRKQEAYEAEVNIFRALESLQEQVIVLHGLDYTNRQFGLFEKYDAKKPPNKVVGECDFVVIGENCVVIIEVSDVRIDETMTSDNNIRKTFSRKKRQGERTEGLIRKIFTGSDESVTNVPFITWFCAFPSLSSNSVTNFTEEESSRIIYNDCVTVNPSDFKQWWLENVTGKTQQSWKKDERMKFVAEMLIGLWNIDSQNDCDPEEKCSVGRNIVKTDKQLRDAEITYSFGRKSSNYINPNFVEADEVFKKIGISYLSKEQDDVFKSEKQFLWINGPAGSGKSVLILGKIIKLRTEKQSSSIEKRVLLFVNMDVARGHECYYEKQLRRARLRVHYRWEALHRAEELEKKVFHCTGCEGSGDNTESRCYDCPLTSDVVIVQVDPHLSRDMFLHSEFPGVSERLETIVTKKVLDTFHVFIDDENSLLGLNLRSKTDVENILEHLAKQDSTSVIWIANDVAQSQRFVQCSPSEPLLLEKAMVERASDHIVTLSNNLRNTVDISKMLSKIRDVILLQPKQVPGHFLHGPLPVVHILNNEDEALIKMKVNEEIDKIFDTRGSAALSGDYKRDLALIKNDWTHSKMLSDLTRERERTIKPKARIHVEQVEDVYSAEWPAVITLMNANTLHFAELYLALSRPRVYCSLILYNYVENKNEDLDLLLRELRHLTKNNIEEHVKSFD